MEPKREAGPVGYNGIQLISDRVATGIHDYGTRVLVRTTTTTYIRTYYNVLTSNYTTPPKFCAASLPASVPGWGPRNRAERQTEGEYR